MGLRALFSSRAEPSANAVMAWNLSSGEEGKIRGHDWDAACTLGVFSYRQKSLLISWLLHKIACE
jgi:hypothetical protein